MKTHKKRIIFIFVLIAMLIFNARLFAQSISGRLTTSVYSWEQQVFEEPSANHFRAYQLVQFNATDLGVKGLGFHTYLNVSHDFGKKAADDPRFWIYNMYLDYRNVVNGLDVGVGRQRIYAGVGYGTVDGLQLKYRFKDYFDLKLYGGMLAPLRKSYEIEEFDTENISWGFHITTSKLKRVRAGISYAQMSRVPVEYTSPGIYTSDFRLDHPVTALQKKLIGIDVRGIVTSKFYINGRVDYNFSLDEIKRGEIGGRYRINRNFDIGLDYIYRTPSIDVNSIFWVFALNPNQEIAFRTNYKYKDYLFHFNVATVLLDGDNSQRVGFGVNWKTLNVSYNHRGGYSGDSDGISVNYNHPLKSNFRLLLNTTLFSYQLITSANGRKEAIAGSAGVQYIHNKFLNVQAQAQFLKNVWFSQDFRFFFRGSYAFTHRFND